MFLDPFMSLESEVVDGMLALSGLQKGEIHVHLGSGEGQFLRKSFELGAIPIGYESNSTLAATSLSLAESLRYKGKAYSYTVITDDVFNANVSTADVVTFWFTSEGTDLLFDKLYKEMKSGARLVMLYDSFIQYRDSQTFVKGYFENHDWKPVDNRTILGNRFYLFRR